MSYINVERKKLRKEDPGVIVINISMSLCGKAVHVSCGINALKMVIYSFKGNTADWH